jgi:endoglucanase
VLTLLRLLIAGALIMSTGACADRKRDIHYAPLRHPFRGATLYRDPDSLAAQWQKAHGAAWLHPITSMPQARWLTSPQDVGALGPALREANRQGALLVLVAYYIPNRDCAGQGAADQATYQAFVEELVSVLGATGAAVILEPDAVAADCFDETRARTLTTAVRTLAGAGHYVYLDAGHPRWRSPQEMAGRLHEAGIADAEGFSVNVSNRQSTADSHRYAVDLSTLVGDREAIIDTSRNGLPAPPDDQWCNPAQQGLGEPATASPSLDRVAALLWVKRPGESDGPCGTETTNDVFSPRQARTLIANAPWVPESARRAVASAAIPGD